MRIPTRDEVEAFKYSLEADSVGGWDRITVCDCALKDAESLRERFTTAAWERDGLTEAEAFVAASRLAALSDDELLAEAAHDVELADADDPDAASDAARYRIAKWIDNAHEAQQETYP